MRSTTDGYEFLLQLLLIVHPKFVTPRKIMRDIPKFSEYTDLYSYARGLQEYQNLQLINSRSYTSVEISLMFLEHIEDAIYSAAIEPAFNPIENLTKITYQKYYSFLELLPQFYNTKVLSPRTLPYLLLLMAMLSMQQMIIPVIETHEHLWIEDRPIDPTADHFAALAMHVGKMDIMHKNVTF